MMGKTSQRHYARARMAVASVARERIEILIGEARQRAGKDEDLARRYVELARRISERTKVRIPSELKRYVCKGCGTLLVPGRNARVRLRARNLGIVMTCLGCGAVKRYRMAKRISSTG